MSGNEDDALKQHLYSFRLSTYYIVANYRLIKYPNDNTISMVFCRGFANSYSTVSWVDPKDHIKFQARTNILVVIFKCIIIKCDFDSFLYAHNIRSL